MKRPISRPTEMSINFPMRAIDLGLSGIHYGEFATEYRGQGVTPFRAAQFSVTPGTKTPRDVHDVRECWYVLSGRGELEYGNDICQVEAGQLVFFESQVTHRVHNTGIADLHILSLWWPADADAYPGDNPTSDSDRDSDDSDNLDDGQGGPHA